MKNFPQYICLLFLIFGFQASSLAQGNSQISLAAEDGGQLQFNTNSELANGKNYPNQVRARIQKYNGTNNTNYWKLTVRLASDFYHQNGNYSVDASHAKLIFNQESNYSTNNQLINPSNVPVPLNKFNEVSLIESNVPLNTQTHRTFSFNFYVEGGTHLLTIPNGIYQTAYEFRLYGKQNLSDNYTLIDNFTTGQIARFHINYNGNYGTQSISLQNSANVFNFNFSTATDYADGKSKTINQGLKITSYNTHQILVKTSNSVFTSSTSSATIPVSKLKVNVNLSSPENNVQTFGPLSLSATDQVLIERSATWPQTLLYDLEFSIPPNALQAEDIQQGGTFSAYVFFTIAPN